MKHTPVLLALAVGITIASCSKNMQQPDQTAAGISSTGAFGSAVAAAGGDRIDSIMKGVAADSYSFSFDKTYASSGITRTAYGADNYLVFADPQDVICGEPLRSQIRKVPVFKRPNFVQPTCQDMSIDIWKLSQIQDLLIKADPLQFRGSKQIKLADGKGLLATEKFFNQYTSLKPDRMDAITKDLNPEKFILLGNADVARGGACSRGFYGWADLNEVVFKKYKTNIKDFLKPNQPGGCFYTEYMQLLRQRLQEFNPSLYKNITVTPFAQDKSISVLSF